MRRLPLRSPLRMRGKGPDDRAHPLVPGITPACAGKRKPHLHKKGCTWDHPRVCGEKLVRLMCCRCLAGSPPRMRGKAVDCPFSLPLVGITPAYAGKSTKQAKQQDKARDHPRVCGEKSPQRTLNHRQGGITPAYAGKSRCNLPSTAPWKDYPRVCGKVLAVYGATALSGSPPRMRGKEQVPDPRWSS